MTTEYGFLVIGGESARPWGTKAQGFVQCPHLDRLDLGIELVNIVIDPGEETGNGKVLTSDTILVPDAWVGAQLRLGTPAIPLGGYATAIANDATSFTVNWNVAAAADGTFQGYLVREPSPYPEVRVLVPYQPEGSGSNAVPYPAGAPVAPPGFVLPAGVTTHEDWGLFLPLDFREGIAGGGISEATDSRSSPTTHVPDDANPPDATTFTWVNGSGSVVTNWLAGGYIHVTHAGGQSWGRIATNTGTVATLDEAGWLGGTPSGTPSAMTFEAWVPHYDNSPHAYIPGTGFRYPGNDMQPCAFGDGRIRNMPRAIATSSYGDRFGPVLEFGYRMAGHFNKRVNLIHLGVNDSTLLPSAAANVDGFLGTIGWWDHTKHSDWSPAKTGGLADRAKKMIQTIAPKALLAEGSAATLKILGIVMILGEEDVLVPAGREAYGRALEEFLVWLRGVITDAGLSPYRDPARIPIVHQLLTAAPWETLYDTEGRLSDSITETVVADGHGAFTDPAESPKISGDLEHFNGIGEGLNAQLAALAMIGLVKEALSFGSDLAPEVDAAVVTICNQALSHIGESPIVSLTEGSADANLCSQFYPLARDAILEDRQWSFALKRASLVPSVTAPPSTWLFAYVLPGDAFHVIAVLPKEAIDDYSTEPTRGATWWEDQWDYRGLGIYTPARYAIEGRLIYTNEADAQLRYVAKLPSVTRFPAQVRLALGYKLATLLAGPIIKGDRSMAVAVRMEQLAAHAMGKAAVRDAQQRTSRVEHQVTWLQNR